MNNMEIFSIIFSIYLTVVSCQGCEEGALSPDPSDCGRYYQCANDQQISMPCGPGTVFSETLSVCVHPSDPAAGNCYTPPTCTDGELLPYPGDCGKYNQCSNGVLYAMSCPAGLHFNPTGQYCDWPETAGCQPGP